MDCCSQIVGIADVEIEVNLEVVQNRALSKVYQDNFVGTVDLGFVTVETAEKK